MNFTTKKIESEIIGIIDIGTYKTRVAITKYKNKDLELIGYGEKRSLITNYNFSNIKKICDNILDGIKKAEINGNRKIEKIILNIPFRELFFESSKINYIRKNHEKKIDKNELTSITKEIINISLKKAFKNIKENNSYSKEQLKLIISNINNILLDKTKNKKLLGKNPKEINISILNVFIPENKYEFIKSIGNILDKKIIKIIPSEYSISKLDYQEKDIVIIDLGSSHTSVIIKLNNEIVGVKKIAMGMNDLIKDIQKNYNKTKIDIIKSIDEGIFLKEKKDFLKNFKDILIITLEEILGKNICPNYFFMLGGGSNKFIKDFLQKSNFNENNLKILKKISFIKPNIEYLGDINSSKSNLNIYSMMRCAVDFIKREKDPVEDSLKIAMKEVS